MFGLIEQDLEYIMKAIRKHAEIDIVKVFGSRAMGNYKKGSDVDLAIFGEHINEKIVARLNDALNEEYPLPYFFDVIHYERITNQQLIEHIDKLGIEIYRK
jgi:uncharacterized protein